MSATTTTRRTVPVAQAFREIGSGKTAGYLAIQNGTFPLRVIRVGKRLLVARADLDRLLGIASESDDRQSA